MIMQNSVTVGTSTLRGLRCRRFGTARPGVTVFYDRFYAYIYFCILEVNRGSYGIAVQWGQTVPNIINRQGDGICPFEAAVLHIQDPQTALTAIREKMVQMNITL